MAITKVTSSVLSSGSATDGYVLTADGSGNSAWEEVAGGPTFKTFGTSSIMIGDTTTGTIDAANYNVGLGIDVFAALTSGDNNIAIGFEAVDALTTGGNNVGIGYKALSASNGSWSVAVGSEALKSEATSGSNVAIGGLSMQTSNGASNNVAVGKQTGYLLTTGDYNSWVGSNSGFNQTTASNNVGMGYVSLYSVTTGVSNTGIGSNALYSCTTASYNTAVGKDACYLNRTGTKLASLGYEAEKNNETGYDNVSIGYQANSTASGAGNGVGRITIGTSVTGYGQEWVTFGRTNSLRTRVALGTTTWASDSDERLKENIQTSSAGLSFINDLRPVTFDWKKKGEIDPSLSAYKEGSEDRIKIENNLNRYGFIAQEVKQAIDNHPEVLDNGEIWQEDEMDGTQGVAPTALIPMLVKAIQELSSEVETLKSQIGN